MLLRDTMLPIFQVNFQAKKYTHFIRAFNWSKENKTESFVLPRLDSELVLSVTEQNGTRRFIRMAGDYLIGPLDYNPRGNSINCFDLSLLFSRQRNSYDWICLDFCKLDCNINDSLRHITPIFHMLYALFIQTCI